MTAKIEGASEFYSSFTVVLTGCKKYSHDSLYEPICSKPWHGLAQEKGISFTVPDVSCNTYLPIIYAVSQKDDIRSCKCLNLVSVAPCQFLHLQYTRDIREILDSVYLQQWQQFRQVSEDYTGCPAAIKTIDPELSFKTVSPNSSSPLS